MTIRRKFSYGETFNPSTPPPEKCSAVYIAALLFIFLSTFAAFPAAALAYSGNGSEANPYLISTADDLSKCVWNSDGHFKLIADIDLTNTAVNTKWFQYSANTGFSGTFDGNGHTIKGLRITAYHVNNQTHNNYNSDGSVNTSPNGVYGYGLFSIISKTGVVKNLILEDVVVDINVSKGDTYGGTTYHAAGAIAGINGGTIENCVVKLGSVKIYGDGNRSGVNRVAGGVVGWNMKHVNQAYIKGDPSDNNLLGLGKIINCINHASVEANGRRQRTGDILSAGGIAGKSEMAATSAKADGNNLHVHATLIQGCANFGSVKTSGKTGTAYAGGIAGSGESSTDIIFCFNAGAVASEEERSGYAFIGGIIGRINANYCGSELLWCANAGIISALNDDNYKGEIVGELRSPINESSGSERYSRVRNCYWSNGEDGEAGAFGRTTDLKTVNIGKYTTMPVYIEAVPTGRATPGGYAGEVQLKIYYADGTEIKEADFSQYAEIVGKPTVSGVSADVTTSGQKITAQTSVESGTFSVTATVKLKQNNADIYEHKVTAFFHAEEYVVPVETLTIEPNDITLSLDATGTASASLTANLTAYDPGNQGLEPGNKNIKWSVTEGTCVTLGQTTTTAGNPVTVTAQSAGTATITATTEGLDKEGKPLTQTVNVTVYGANVDDTDKAIIEAITGGTGSGGVTIPSGAQGGSELLNPSKREATTSTGSAGADVVTTIETNAAEMLGTAAGNVAVAGTDGNNMKIFSSQADTAGTDAYWRVTATAEFTPEELSAANIGDITKETVIVTLLVDTGNGTWEPVTLTGLATPDSFTLEFTETGGVNVTVPAIVFDKAAQSGEAIVTPLSTPNADGTTTPHYLIMDGRPDGEYKFAIAIAAADSGTQAAGGVTIDRPVLTLAKDDQVQLTATVTPANAANKNVTWVSSDETVVTVSQDGTVTAVAEGGTATVSAVSVQGGYTASCEVTVTDVGVVTKSESYKYITGATVYVPGTWPEEIINVSVKNDEAIKQAVLENLLEHGKHDTKQIDGMEHAEPDSVSVLAAFTLSVEHGGAAASGKSIEIDIDLPTAIDIREGYYLYALIAPKTNNEQREALPFHSFPCLPSQGTNITSLKFTVDDYAAYFTDNHVYLAESKTAPVIEEPTPDIPPQPDVTPGGDGGGGCSAGFGTLALLALVPIILKRRK